MQKVIQLLQLLLNSLIPVGGEALEKQIRRVLYFLVLQVGASGTKQQTFGT